MKRLLIIIIVFLYSGLLYAQTAQEIQGYYDEALALYEEQYYAKATELLIQYIQSFPYDKEANKLFEIIYEKYTVFQMEYLEAKGIFNQGLYSDALDALIDANQYGNSAKLQYYKDEAQDQIFKIENLFLNSSIDDSGDSLTVSWWTDYTNTVFTNASVYFVKGYNIPLFNTIQYFNRNEILLPNLADFLGYANIFDAQKVRGTSATFEKNPDYPTFMMIIYPETPDGIMTQPIIELYVEEPEIEGNLSLMEDIETVAFLPQLTNYSILLPVDESLLIAKIDSDIKKTLDKLIEPDKVLQQTNLLESTNIPAAWIGESTNVITGPGTEPRRHSLWWLWLLILIVIYLIWRVFVYRKRMIGEGKPSEMSVVHFFKTGLIPRPEDFRFRTGLLIWAVLSLSALSGLFAAVTVPEGMNISEEVWEYAVEKYQVEDYQSIDYRNVVNFMAFESGITNTDYLRALDLISNVSKHLREVASTYLDMYEYDQYALYSFMVYYLSKDFSFYTKAISELKDTTKKKVGYEMLTNSQIHEDEGKYLKALIEYTGFMALVPTAIKGDSFTVLNDLFEEHKTEFGRFVHYHLIDEINAIHQKVLYSGLEKAIYAYIEILSFEDDFSPVDSITEYKQQLEEYIEMNYLINLYNDLIGYGVRLYRNQYIEESIVCYSLADQLLELDRDDLALLSNLCMLSNYLKKGAQPVCMIYTNSNGVVIDSELSQCVIPYRPVTASK